MADTQWDINEELDLVVQVEMEAMKALVEAPDTTFRRG
jgi:hypothetical protein